MPDDHWNDVDFFSNLRVAIVGLGLMGGSLALALRDRCETLMAVDPDPITRDFAIQERIVNQIAANPTDILPHANLVILAAPVNAILDLIPNLPELHPDSAVIIDFGSTKTQICQELGKLPKRFEPVGGHPMCGKAVGGLQYAEAGLFCGMPFAFTLLPNTTDKAFRIAQQLAGIIGSHPVWTGPNTHDSWVAATSHLPYLVSSALTLATPTEAAQLVGSGFRSTTRLAGSPSAVMLPILETNTENVLAAIARFRQQIDQLEEILSAGDFSKLKEYLNRAEAYHAVLTTQ